MTDNIIDLNEYRHVPYSEDEIKQAISFDIASELVVMLYEQGYDVRVAPLTMREISVILESIKAILSRIDGEETNFHKITDRITEITEEQATKILSEFTEDLLDQ